MEQQIGSGPLIVTRHKALALYLMERGIVPAGTEVIPHARPQDVRGRDVYGILPVRLACMARTYTEVPLALEQDDRYAEIPLERLREIANEPASYRVVRLGPPVEQPENGEEGNGSTQYCEENRAHH